MDGGINRSLPACLSLGHHLQIGVDNHNGVVDNHTQCHNQGSQRHRVQLDVEHIEQAQRYKDGDGHRTGSHSSYAERHDEHHHKDHRADGYHQFVEEVIDRVVHHLGLIGNGV